MLSALKYPRAVPATHMTDPASLITSLNMTPHPEGGHFAETYRADDGSASLIFYLLQQDERSHWHRLTKNEMLHFYDGDPLKLLLSPDGVSIEEKTLGREAVNNEFYHRVVPKDTWFSMQSTGDWSLIGCTVSPAFSFDDFELAPRDWMPGHGQP